MKPTTKLNTKVGRTSKDRHGRPGVAVRLELDADGWQGVYHLGTHGLSSAEVLSERDRIVAHHEAKAARLADIDAFGKANEVMLVAGERFTFVETLLTERGTNVSLTVRYVSSTGERLTVERIYPTIADVPSTSAIRTMTRDAATAFVNSAKVTANAARSIAQLLGAKE